MYGIDSSLIGGASAVPARWVTAIARHNPEEAAAIVTAYQEACGAAGIAADLAIAQACDECAWFDHVRWRVNRNPAGIGIVSDATAGVSFGSITNGIDAHVGLLCCYAYGERQAVPASWIEPYGYGGFQRDRPRLGDLDGSWAVPGDGYAAAIAAIANGVVGMDQPQPRVITGTDVVSVALSHEGETHERDTWNGDHLVTMMCQADVEDWQAEATGTEPQHFGSAKASRVSAPVQFGEPELGAQIWMSGPEWSEFDHTGVYMGDGRVISGLSSVVVTTGWIDRPDFAGWRRLAGVSAAVVAPPPPLARPAPGNPIAGNALMLHPFSSRWFLLDALGLALPMMGWPVAPEYLLPNGRRVQQFQRGLYGVQDAAAPWDLVQLLPAELVGTVAPLPPRQS